MSEAPAISSTINTQAPTDESARRKDVWSRSGTKYRFRAIVLLVINVILFAGVGCFAFWIRSGVAFAPAMDSYWDTVAQTFNFSRETPVSLADLLYKPINVQDVPLQIPIIGLLMAALIAIPILISILYRFWSSIPFILVVGFLAVMPWLAITLLGSCILASIKPFRARFRFMSALVALVPTVIYLFLAWDGSAEMIMGRVDPIERIMFIAPWVLAIVAATAVFALVLVIAHIVDYRPGAIAPLLALMFGLPVGLFEFKVGRDELHYRILEDHFAAQFADWDATLSLNEATMREWENHPHPRPRLDAIRELKQQQWAFQLGSEFGGLGTARPHLQSELAPFRSALARHQNDVVARCNLFLKNFPDSRYALNVLFLKARALDMRVDAGEYRRTQWIRFYDSFPSPASRPVWETLEINARGSALGAHARIRLAQFAARDGEVERAMDLLKQSITMLDTQASTPATAQLARISGNQILERVPPEATLKLPIDQIKLKATNLLELLRHNRDPIYNYDPLCGTRPGDVNASPGFLDLDPRNESYVENLRRLRERFPRSKLGDNIDLAIALRAPLSTPAFGSDDRVPTRIELLQRFIAEYPRGDALPEALYQLGVGYFHLDEEGRGGQVHARLIAEFPDSIWAAHARKITDAKAIAVFDEVTHG